MGNPINPAMDQLLFTTDIDEVYRLVTSDDAWVVYDAFECDGKRQWMLGRVSKERVKDLPKFLAFYEDDVATTLERMAFAEERGKLNKTVEEMNVGYLNMLRGFAENLLSLQKEGASKPKAAPRSSDS